MEPRFCPFGMTRDPARVSFVFCSVSAFQGEFRENHGLSSSLGTGFQAGLAALRLTAGNRSRFRQGASGLCPAASAFLGLGPVCSVHGLCPARLFLGSAQYSFGSVQFDLVSVRFDRFGLIWSRMTGSVR